MEVISAQMGLVSDEISVGILKACLLLPTYVNYDVREIFISQLKDEYTVE